MESDPMRLLPPVEQRGRHHLHDLLSPQFIVSSPTAPSFNEAELWSWGREEEEVTLAESPLWQLTRILVCGWR